jgi:hypothetical protein
MKASELRIGNFVKDKNAQYKTVNGFSTILATSIYQFNLGDLELDALPLTEEWLLKFGFVKEPRDSGEVAFCMSENDCNVIIQDFGDGFLFIWELSFMGKPIKYVHQLQNLYFALTGKELEYEQN